MNTTDSKKLTYQRCKDHASLRAIERMAHTIWNEYYPAIIGQPQVDYMLKNMHSSVAMHAQIKEDYHFYLVSLDCTPIGYLSFRPEKDFLFLSKIYLLKAYRGQGLSRRMLNFVKTRSKDRNLKRIRLTVNKYNERSIRAYEHIGFIKKREIVMDIGHGFVMDDFMMELELSV